MHNKLEIVNPEYARYLRGDYNDSHILETKYDYEKYKEKVNSFLHEVIVSEIWLMIVKGKKRSIIKVFPRIASFGFYTDIIWEDLKTDEQILNIEKIFNDKGYTVKFERKRDGEELMDTYLKIEF